MTLLRNPIDINVVLSLHRSVQKICPFCNSRRKPLTFSHPSDLAIGVEMGCGIELHDHLVIPCCQFLTHKISNSTCSKALMHMGKEVPMLSAVNVLPVNIPGVSNNGLLIH